MAAVAAVGAFGFVGAGLACGPAAERMSNARSRSHGRRPRLDCRENAGGSSASPARSQVEAPPGTLRGLCSGRRPFTVESSPAHQVSFVGRGEQQGKREPCGAAPAFTLLHLPYIRYGYQVRQRLWDRDCPVFLISKLTAS